MPRVTPLRVFWEDRWRFWVVKCPDGFCFRAFNWVVSVVWGRVHAPTD